MIGLVLITIRPDSPAPIYEQIAAAIRRKVADGELSAGDRLPAARDLADALGVNLHTVLRGYQQLRDEGLVELRRGRGAVVTSSAPETAGWRHALTAFIDEARRAGLSTDEAVQHLQKGMS